MFKLEIKKIYTENPFVDSLLYCVKILAFGSIVKLSDLADNAETENSVKQSDLYIASIENRGVFDLFSYSEKILNLSSLPKANMADYLKNKYLIPEAYRDEVTKLAMEDCIESYNEENDYYRMICGLPPSGVYGIPIKNYEYLIPEGNEVNYTYVHELGADGARMLELYGILDMIKADYPDAKYLNYITSGISVYKARKAMNFQILYMPTTSILEIDDKFSSKYELNRSVAIKTIYSEAFKIRSDYYDNFIGLLIMVMTMTDMLTEVQEHIIKKDILDSRCIEYIFSMYDVPYYNTIPLKYQTNMCKNINSLIKYKSCQKGMLNLISLFGVDNIEVFKYFILRDRKTDVWGEFIYNTTTNITSKENDIVIHKQDSKPVSNDTVPFPFDYFLQKGNVMFVWVDGYRLKESIDYEVYNYDKILFKNGVSSGKNTITYDFYYDKTTVDSEFQPDKENGISMVTHTFLNESNTNSFTFTPPYPEYFIDKNSMIVSIGGVFLDSAAYVLDLSANTITINGEYKTKDKEIIFIYLYGKKLTTMFKKYNAIATVNGQSRFTIPEPFTNYVDNGNDFFVTIGSTYIDPRRYITSDGQIIFNDITLDKNREVSFNFIYSAAAIYAPVNMMQTYETVTATQYYQYEFKINLPISDYLKYGYKVYVKLRGWYLSDEYYDVYSNKLVFRDRSISLQPGEKMEICYIYGPTARNIIVLKDYRTAEVAYQDKFSISYPISDFFTRGNKVIIDCNGALLEENIDYQFNTDKSQITIIDKDLLPYITQKVNYTFIYNIESDYSIKIEQQVISATANDQKIFYLTFPFYPYLETTHGFIIMHNSLIVDPTLITVNKYNCYIDMDGIKTGDEIVVLYIFNNKYLIEKNELLTVEEKTVVTNLSINDDLFIDVPVPFYDYIQNYWDYFVDYKRNRIVDEFEIISNGLMFVDPAKILSYDSLTFTFVYKDSYLIKEEDEDYAKDIDLKFVKIPLTAKTNTDYLKKRTNTKSYDGITLNDKFWDGEDNQENAHEVVKEQILKQQFNYARTKYMTLEYLVNLSDMAFEIPYFYNMLYDDVFREDLLTAKVPTISPNKNFKLSHLFCYMTSLAYMYSGVDDTIMDSPTKILYVKGFNFKTDLNSLKEYILDQRRLPEDFDVFNFINPNGQIPDIDSFINIYKTNKDVYKTICYGMTEARNYDIYKIWKKLYDSLMIWQFNLEFFKLSNGKVASTFTNFLQEKDNVLYVSLKRIEAISDQETRENTIITTISDIVYILEEYINTKEFKYIYSQFPGVSGEYVLRYLFTMINFFKSYKVVLNQMNVQLIIDDKSQNTIRPYDTQAMQIHLEKPDYINIVESKSSSVSLIKSDSIEIKEKLSFSYYQQSN
jgi:hypothetical protein